MPFYEYQCESCGREFVLLQPMGAKAEDTECPYCREKKARKLLSKFSSGNAGVCSIGGHSWGGG
jgi:putative FmdB family regulatory protein